MRGFSASYLPEQNFFIIVGCSPGVTDEKRICNCTSCTGLETWNPFCKCYDALVIFHSLAKLMQFCVLLLLKHRELNREEEGKAVQCCSYNVESCVPQTHSRRDSCPFAQERVKGMSLTPWALDMVGQHLLNMLAVVISPFCEAHIGLIQDWPRKPPRRQRLVLALLVCEQLQK